MILRERGTERNEVGDITLDRKRWRALCKPYTLPVEDGQLSKVL
jgi:hypothetical protein